jgi:hypothetical protein
MPLLDRSVIGIVRTTLKRLLPDDYTRITEFLIEYIAESRYVKESIEPEEAVTKAFEKLKELHLKEEKIASQAQLLGHDPETLQRNFEFLRDNLHIKKGKIAGRAQLLGRDPETLQRNFDFLRDTLHLKRERIAELAQLLWRDPETLQRNFEFLRDKLRIKGGKIASQAQLLGNDPETLQRNFEFLRDKLHIKKGKIASQAQLLGRDQKTLQRNFEFLRDRLHLKEKKIASSVCLLNNDPETLQRNFEFLRDELHLKEKKIATLAQLLGRDPETLQYNYESHVSILRSDQKDRTSGRSTIAKQAQLLGTPSQTMMSNVQYLRMFFRIEPNKNAMLLGTTVSLKRAKFAFLLREVFDYREAKTAETKAERIEVARMFLNRNSRLLLLPIGDLKKNVEGLKRKAEKFKMKAAA